MAAKMLEADEAFPMCAELALDQQVDFTLCSTLVANEFFSSPNIKVLL